MLIALHSARSDLFLAPDESFLVTLVADVADLRDAQPDDGWDALVVDTIGDPERAWSLVRRAREEFGIPILAVVAASDLARTNLADDFAVEPATAAEIATRLRRLGGEPPVSEVILFKDLELNLATYQATIAGYPIDLTFMEYELLRFFATHSTRVWSRQQILSKVWGYDYFGGSRTVDVHVRRLRAKLGEERSSWITTVRSVGYRFG